MVELLQRYTKNPWSEIPTETLIQDAKRSQVAAEKLNTARSEKLNNPLRVRAKTLSDADIEELVEGYGAGSSTYALARQFDINRQTVGEHLRRNGIPLRSPKLVTLDKEQASMANELRASGWSIHRIAVRLGVADRAIARSLQSSAITEHGPTKGN